ncbi:hypothetical protein J5X84_39565 [Streptosporangiaceae bacterium NEAU-GS5]|nr:hypothetical protein [Streptosporangiaceae bacterium NEAU-GS5]
MPMSDTTAVSREHAVTALVSEYEALKAEERQRIGVRGQLLYATLTAVAGIATVTATAGRLELLLLLPLATTVLGWSCVTNDHKIVFIGRYVRYRLGPRMVGLAGEFSSGIDMFDWEHYHRADPLRRSRKWLQLAADMVAFCVPSLTAIALLLLLGPHNPLVLIGSAAAIIAVTILAAQIVRYAGAAGPDGGPARRP